MKGVSWSDLQLLVDSHSWRRRSQSHIGGHSAGTISLGIYRLQDLKDPAKLVLVLGMLFAEALISVLQVRYQESACLRSL